MASECGGTAALVKCCKSLREESLMRTGLFLRPLIAALSVGALLVAAPACKKSPAPTENANAEPGVNAEAAVGVESVEKAPGAITEDNDFGSITYTVAPEGKVQAVV